MKKLHRPSCAVLLAAALASTAYATDKPFVTVNGTPVSQATADMYGEHARANGVTDPAALQAQVRDEIIRRELLFQAAHRAGFDRNPQVAAEAEAARRKVLLEADAVRQTIIIRRYVEDYIARHPADDAQLHALYDRMRASGNGTEYKVHHLVLKNESDANAVVAKLKGGARFEDAVRDARLPAPPYNGGDEGWVTPGRFIKPVADAMQKLKKGALTDPAVKADDGYHVVRVDDTRPLNVPAFEDMKPMLAQQAQEQLVVKMTSDLRSSAVIR